MLGLGAAPKLDWVEIQWPEPGSTRERLTDVPVDRYVTVVEGKGHRRLIARLTFQIGMAWAIYQA